jgi:hypothetical protein
MLIMESIKREDPLLNQLASEALVAIGRDVVHTLVLEFLTTKSTRYQVRLLSVIAEIGEVPDPADHLELFNMNRSKNVAVREAAARAIWAVGPHGPRRAAAIAPQAGSVAQEVPAKPEQGPIQC